MASYKGSMLLTVLVYSLISNTNGQLNSCRNYPCKNNGRCVEQSGTLYGYSCICVNPWGGVNCDQHTGGGGGGHNPHHNYHNNPNNNNPNNYPNNNNPNSYPNYNPNNYPNNPNNYPNGKPYNPNINPNINPYNPNNNPNINPYNPNNNPNINPYNPNNNPNINPYNPNINPYNPNSGGSGIYINNLRSGCASSPCYNAGYCQPGQNFEYRCQCAIGYYGDRCESSRKNQIIGIVLGTILPIFALIIIVSIVVYCCCCKRKGIRVPDHA